MSISEKYTNLSSSFLRAPDEGGAPAPAGPTPAPVAVTGDGGGASPAPSDAPSPADASNTSADSDFSGFDADDLDSIDLGTETVPGQDPPAAAPAAAVKAPPAAGTPAPEKPPAAPVVASPDPKGPAASAPPPSELDALVQGVEANSPALTEWLAQNAFALTKEEADAFELDAVANVPKLMARVAVNNMKSTMNIVRNLVPQLIAAEVAKISGAQTKAKEAIGEFYKSNPHLNEEAHGPLVTKWANAFRAANPKASRKEAIEYVGRAVSFETGLMPGAAPAPRAQVPFQPARPGGRQPIVTNSQDEGAFAGLGETFDE